MLSISRELNVLSMILLVFKYIQHVRDFAGSFILKVANILVMKMLLQFLGMICKDKAYIFAEKIDFHYLNNQNSLYFLRTKRVEVP